MGVAFSFELDVPTDLTEIIQYIEHKGFKQITGNFYLSNTCSVVDVVVLIQDILKRYPIFQTSAKKLNYYKIVEISSMQCLVNGSSNAW